MTKSVAVVAHHDFGNQLSNCFVDLVAALARQFDKVVVISTCERIDNAALLDGLAMVIVRPNIGYDFYSYKVGIWYSIKEFGYCNILLINSSLLLADSSRFSKLLVRLGNYSESVVGLTKSFQISEHLQSYFIYFPRAIVRKQFFLEFWRDLTPKNTKSEIIICYEVGLSRLLIRNDITLRSFFVPNFELKVRSFWSYFKKLCEESSIRGLKNLRFMFYARGANWSHFGANAILEDYGVVKEEVIRSNPYEIPFSNYLADFHERLYGKGPVSPMNSSYLSKRAVFGVPRAEVVQVAVVLHLFYFELYEGILENLRNIVCPFDLYVTTPNEEDVAGIFDLGANIAASITVYVVENRGRDVEPFLRLYRSRVLDGYSSVLKIHSKKSRYSEKGDYWRSSLLDDLCGNSRRVMGFINKLENGEVGLIGPGKYHLSNSKYWGANREGLAKILNDMGCRQFGAPPLDFFAGTMFWFAPSAFSRLQMLSENALRFQPEAGQQDGTLAHVFERAFCLIVRCEGYRVISTDNLDSEVDPEKSKMNTVPVL